MSPFNQFAMVADIFSGKSFEHVIGNGIAIGIMLAVEVYWIWSVRRAFKYRTRWSRALGWVGAGLLLLQLVAAIVYLLERRNRGRSVRVDIFEERSIGSDPWPAKREWNSLGRSTTYVLARGDDEKRSAADPGP